MTGTKSKQQRPPLNKEERLLAALKAQKIRESAFKLVVKIISWESGSEESIVMKSANKITPDEWSQYKKHRFDMDTSFNKEHAKKNLSQAYNSIKANGGFE